jgi:hypothetical protein
MDENARLRVQIFTNLSLALIAAAFTTVAGVVAGFALNAEKLPLVYTFFVGTVVLGACVCLILSIYYGGRGVNTTHNTIRDNPAGVALPDNYDGGNFNRQAITGIAGLFLGLLVFILIGIGEAIQPPPTSVVKSLLSDIQRTQAKVNTLEEKISHFEDVQQQSSGKILTSIQDTQKKLNTLEGKINSLEDVQKHSVIVNQRKVQKK